MASPGADLHGLRRLDAVVLIAAALGPDKTRSLGWFKRVFLLRRYRVRSALMRLEARAYIERGWTLEGSHIRCTVTAAGERAARAAAVMLELEDFSGPI